jgi:hypothetical protein
LGWRPIWKSIPSRSFSGTVACRYPARQACDAGLVVLRRWSDHQRRARRGRPAKLLGDDEGRMAATLSYWRRDLHCQQANTPRATGHRNRALSRRQRRGVLRPSWPPSTPGSTVATAVASAALYAIPSVLPALCDAAAVAIALESAVRLDDLAARIALLHSGMGGRVKQGEHR